MTVAIRGTLVVMLTLRVIGWCNLRRGDKRAGATQGHGVIWRAMGILEAGRHYECYFAGECMESQGSRYY